MHAPPARSAAAVGTSSGSSRRKPAEEGASIRASYQRGPIQGTSSGPWQDSHSLDQFLKWQGLVFTGGEAKQRIQGGECTVNGLIETRRGRKLALGRSGRVRRTDADVVPPNTANRAEQGSL